MPAPIFGPMLLDDVPTVGVLERVCFSAPWSEETYRHELKHNPRAFYYVLRSDSADHAMFGATPVIGLPPILAYGGYWVLGDEAHIVTIASHPRLRRRGLGELMLLYLIARAREAGVVAVTLEVRASNAAAQALYAKWGFVQVGLRKRYYRDNNEDAQLLTLYDVDQPRVWAPVAAALAQLQEIIDLTGVT